MEERGVSNYVELVEILRESEIINSKRRKKNINNNKKLLVFYRVSTKNTNK